MARSYDSRRYPGGPYLEPTVQPALRGPKRTGPIGELVPGDDIEVARILARLGRRPKREPVVIKIKLSQDGASAATPAVGDGLFIDYITEDMDLLLLYRVELWCTTVASAGIATVQLRNITATPDADMLTTKVTIDVGDKNSKDAAVSYVIDWDKAQVHWGDEIAIDYDVAGTGLKGLGIQLSYK